MGHTDKADYPADKIFYLLLFGCTLTGVTTEKKNTNLYPSPAPREGGSVRAKQTKP